VLIYVRCKDFYLTLVVNWVPVIALVEYLTSEEAGQPLGSRFAWPVGYMVARHGSLHPSQASKKLENTHAIEASKK
jgi:hypothetical protein